MKRSFLALASLAAIVVGSAQFTARQAFLSAPYKYAVDADSMARLDMLDYFDAGAKHSTPTMLGDRASITSLSPSRLDLQIDSIYFVSYCLLPVKGDTVIAMLETYALPQLDSRLRIFSREWQPLPKAWQAPKSCANQPCEYRLQGDTLSLSSSTSKIYLWNPTKRRFK